VMLDKLSSLYSVQCQMKGLVFRLEVASNIPRYLRGDRQKLFQVLINLVSNALKFTPAGEIRVSVSALGDLLCFRVSDTGPGIPADEMKTIFEPFTRSAQPTVKGGTGLGLAITRWYVNLMGGEISLESRVGRGCTFQILVHMTPVMEQEAQIRKTG